MLTLRGYHEAGGVKKAITQTAESVYDHLTPAEQTIARGIFLRLTELGEGVQDTRRRVKMDELAQNKEQDSVAKVLKTLADARLVTTEEDSAEVAHEALIREWGTLRKWLDEDRESLRTHRHLTESAGEWQRRGKEASELYRGARLKQLQDWLKEHSDALSPLEREFVKASQNVKKRERMDWFAIAGVGVVLLLTIVLAMTGKLNHFIYRPVDMEDYWATIPAGKFQMGSSDKEIEYAKTFCSGCDFSDEQPQHWVDLPEYEIGKYEVTNRQYAQCVKAGICAGSAYDDGKALHPVVNVNWYGAVTYCEWVGGRLPTEAEWEKAARGTDGRTYPWGEGVDCDHANYYGKDNGNSVCVGDTTPVGSYESGKSPYGVYDMAGNVWEWVSSLYMPYSFSLTDGREDMNSSDVRTLRGGSWGASVGLYIRSAIRYWRFPAETDSGIGFRCARSRP
jgi:formylglycine-generating enzyme required for sulfatase activity